MTESGALVKRPATLRQQLQVVESKINAEFLEHNLSVTFEAPGFNGIPQRADVLRGDRSGTGDANRSGASEIPLTCRQTGGN
jgi:hypothetical protein